MLLMHFTVFVNFCKVPLTYFNRLNIFFALEVQAYFKVR